MNIQRRYFFSDGLRFECIRCGACCTGEPGIVRVSEAEILCIADWLKRSVDEFFQESIERIAQGYGIRERKDGACMFWRDTGCSIYPVRPQQCRLYPFWFKLLRNRAAWEAEKKRCPGIGKGRCYAEAEIIERLTLSMAEYICLEETVGSS